MAFRLQILLDGRRLRFALSEGSHEIGSSRTCALRIPHPTVSRRHAIIEVADGKVLIRDLGSHNGVRLGTRKISRADLKPGASLYIGGVPAQLEEVADDDLVPGVVLDNGPTASGQGAATRTDRAAQVEPTVEHSTCTSSAIEELATGHLPSLLDRIEHGIDPELLAQLVGAALLAILPGASIEVTRETDQTQHAISDRRGTLRAPAEAVIFSDSGGQTRSEHEIRCPTHGMELRVTLPDPRLEQVYLPVVELAGQLIRLAETRAPAPPPQPERPAQPPRLPDPPTLVPSLRAIYAEAAQIARGDVSALILGESGTGKEILAQYLHRASARTAGPFLGLNCASLPTDLLETELFGIERGVATGVDARPGKFELASGGTLFLDEIGDMSLETQAKILRVLQSGEVYRVGGTRPRQVDVRIIAATNRDLDEMRTQRLFREDLYHRIATWVATLPELRHRRADIPNLAAFFLRRQAAKRGIRVGGISRAALDRLTAFSWPGNVRQLENEMARAVLFLDTGDLLDAASLSDCLRRTEPAPGSRSRLSEVLDEAQRQEIERALEGAGGNQSAAAKRLGISRSTLYRRMRAFGMIPWNAQPS